MFNAEIITYLTIIVLFVIYPAYAVVFGLANSIKFGDIKHFARAAFQVSILMIAFCLKFLVLADYLNLLLFHGYYAHSIAETEGKYSSKLITFDWGGGFSTPRFLAYVGGTDMLSRSSVEQSGPSVSCPFSMKRLTQHYYSLSYDC
jgi:hypothetical protein